MRSLSFVLALVLAAAPLAAQSALPFINKHLYSTTANAQADIANALFQAKKEHKRIILAFGGDWCGDCQVLDIYMHQAPNAEILDHHFIVVHIDIGDYDHNVAIAHKYRVPIEKGVPALAVLDANGNVLYSQRNKEFTALRNMNVASVTEFLNRWKS